MRREADAMRACRRAGLRVPEVLARRRRHAARHRRARDAPRRRARRIARRILRDDEYAGAAARARRRPRPLPRRAARDRSRRGARAPSRPTRSAIWDKYQRLDDRSPTFEKRARRGCSRTGRRTPPTRSIHGDLRMGNVIVEPDGLAAVIDWELVHRRRSARGPRLAVRQGVALRRAARGRRPRHRSTSSSPRTKRRAAARSTATRCTGGWSRRPSRGASAAWCRPTPTCPAAVRSVELAAVGRRVAEQEWDLIELLAPDACAAALAAPLPAPLPDDADRYGRPTARELLDAVREFLTDDVDAERRPRRSPYEARVAANVLGDRRARARAGSRSTTTATTGRRSRSPCATGSPSPTRSTSRGRDGGSSMKVVIYGVTGVIGRAAAEHFVALPGWEVVGVSRRPADVAGVQHVPLDLLDRARLHGGGAISPVGGRQPRGVRGVAGVGRPRGWLA